MFDNEKDSADKEEKTNVPQLTPLHTSVTSPSLLSISGTDSSSPTFTSTSSSPSLAGSPQSPPSAQNRLYMPSFFSPSSSSSSSSSSNSNDPARKPSLLITPTTPTPEASQDTPPPSQSNDALQQRLPAIKEHSEENITPLASCALFELCCRQIAKEEPNIMRVLCGSKQIEAKDSKKESGVNQVFAQRINSIEGYLILTGDQEKSYRHQFKSDWYKQQVLIFAHAIVEDIYQSIVGEYNIKEGSEDAIEEELTLKPLIDAINFFLLEIYFILNIPYSGYIKDDPISKGNSPTQDKLYQ